MDFFFYKIGLKEGVLYKLYYTNITKNRDPWPGRGDEVFEVTGPPEATLSAPEMASLLSEELGRSIRYEEISSPPMPAYAQLWDFLRAGGFDCSTGTFLLWMVICNCNGF